MPGGFHPFHAGHAALYQSALKAFPDADVYVAATNSQETRPFPFAVKEKLAKVAGVAPGHFVQVKSPFQAKEITQNYNPDEDVLIFVRSEKDKNESPKPGGTKKDGSPAYFQPYNSKNLQPFSKHAYFAYLPTVEFGPGITSATEIRNAWPTLNDKRKTAMVMSLYPAAQKNPKLAANIVGMLDQVMGGQINELDQKKSWQDYGMPEKEEKKPLEKRYHDWAEYENKEKKQPEPVAEGYGLPMPSTYEQERGVRTPSTKQRITAMTNENHDLDAEMSEIYRYAMQRYPNARDKQEAFAKYVQRALKHSEEDDVEQNQRINVLDKEVDLLQKQINQVKVSESMDYLEEK